jgi:hypothetical protein
MVEANYTISGSNTTTQQALDRANNFAPTFTTENYLLNRKPDFLVYLYNVSDMTFKVSRPPTIREMTIPGKNGAGLNPDMLEKMKAAGLLKGQEDYILVTKFPSPMVTSKSSTDSDTLDFSAIDGRRFVMDLVNPDNLGIDQDAVISNRTGIGNDLGAKGVFWSLNYPPTEEEVAKAKNRMERFLQKKLDEARAVETSNPAGLADFLTPEHHAAAEYYGEDTSWHGKRSRPVDCEQCGTRLKSDLAFHKLDDGLLCVRNVAKALKAGVITRAKAYEMTGDVQYAPQAPVAPAV